MLRTKTVVEYYRNANPLRSNFIVIYIGKSSIGLQDYDLSVWMTLNTAPIVQFSEKYLLVTKEQAEKLFEFKKVSRPDYELWKLAGACYGAGTVSLKNNELVATGTYEECSRLHTLIKKYESIGSVDVINGLAQHLKK